MSRGIDLKRYRQGVPDGFKPMAMSGASLIFRRLLRGIACVLMGAVFFLIAGGPLAVLQLVAWTTMLHDFSRTGSLSDAVGKTFDGEHLCPLCKKIAKVRASEEKSPSTAKPEKKAEVFVVLSSAEIPPPTCRLRDYGATPFILMPERLEEPPVPVPREIVS